MPEPRALSFTRPWDELILLGLKPIENRTWLTSYRGQLIVHAAKSWDPWALDVALENGVDPAIVDSLGTAKTAPTGYRGAVTLTTICRGASHYCTCGPWAFDGQTHWHVSDPIRLPQPIAGPGRLGLWEPPADVLDALAVSRA